MNSFQYLNDSVWCRIGVSSLHGVGVFAIRDIQKGTKLTDHTLQDIFDSEKNRVFVLSHEEFSQILPEIRSLILDRQILDRQTHKDHIYFMSPNNDVALQSFMNHSEEPNSDGEHALQDIKKGEEITENFKHVVTDMHQLSKDHFTFL